MLIDASLSDSGCIYSQSGCQVTEILEVTSVDLGTFHATFFLVDFLVFSGDSYIYFYVEDSGKVKIIGIEKCSDYATPCNSLQHPHHDSPLDVTLWKT